MKGKIQVSLVILALSGAFLCSEAALAGGGLEGNQACESCIEAAQAEWNRCIDLPIGPDPGDADCASRLERAIMICQSTYCIY